MRSQAVVVVVGGHLANVRESAGGGAGPAHGLLLELFLQQP